MQLKKAVIKNFRSIKNAKIDFEPNCRILVGINESGKSNILKAMSFLSENSQFSNEDKRFPSNTEMVTSESFIKFFFDLEWVETEEIYDKINESILALNLNLNFFEVEKKKYNIRDFFKEFLTGVYTVDFITKQKSFNIEIQKSYEIIDYWKKPSASIPKDISLENRKKEIVNAHNFKIINKKDYPKLESFLENLSKEDIEDILKIYAPDIMKKKVPNCIIWEYDVKNLLPQNLDLDAFSNDPDICKPLKHMFNAYNIIDIKKQIEENQKTPRGLKNLLNSIAKNTTKIFRQVWETYENIEFELSLNSNLIEASIKDDANSANSYTFSQRSDGFKRFITFLLMISLQVKTNAIKNNLILIDEPDVSLSISASRFLKDELINISENNFVVYSTHSIFMIDTNKINRHLIVKKKGEVSEVKEVNYSNIKDEEVIFNALGYSIFENIGEKNIIFEGWKDKKLFEIAREKFSENETKDIQTVHIGGAKQIENNIGWMALSKKRFLIVTDNDEVPLEFRKKFLEKKLYGTWKTYSEIVNNQGIVTVEDFLKKDFVEGIAQEFFKESINLPETNIISHLKSLSKKEYPQNYKDTLEEIKDKLFEKVVYEDIKEEYKIFIKNLLEYFSQT